MDASVGGIPLPYITGAGGALVVLALVAWAFYIGKLHSDPEFQRETARADREAARADTEAAARRDSEAARVEQGRALAVSNARADAAVRASELIASAMTSAGRSKDALPPA